MNEPSELHMGEPWAIILGASSGFGLATARKLAREGFNLCLVHRDRRGAMSKIQPAFSALREQGIKLISFNVNALDNASRDDIVMKLQQTMGEHGRISLLLHSIALGNLKLLVPERTTRSGSLAALAQALAINEDALGKVVDKLFEQGHDAIAGLASPVDYPAHALLDDEDFSQTIHAMGTSLVGWTRAVFDAGLFAADARVLGLTSEGNSIAWKGYAAVAAAKSALESVARAMAVELAPHGIRVNIVQAGVTETAALKAIPGHRQMVAQARGRNPFGRLTQPEDVADVIYLLSTPEARWINGDIIRVDGGEHISGLSA
jgi:NAD(P)-dependent dehydrogenase (short-subunit alcohol dehydrogenase family)